MSNVVKITDAKVFKANAVSVLADLGLVVGKAIVCTEKGEDHFDLQGDHIPKLVMIESAMDFAEGTRVHKVMHEGEEAGQFLFLMPITAETCKSLGIEADWEGLAVGFAPAPDVLAKYVDGTYTGFSIGGLCAYTEEATVAEAA